TLAASFASFPEVLRRRGARPPIHAPRWLHSRDRRVALLGLHRTNQSAWRSLQIQTTTTSETIPLELTRNSCPAWALAPVWGPSRSTGGNTERAGSRCPSPTA